MQASVTKQDLLNLINDNASLFNDAKKLTRYLTDADQYLVNFDINFLNNLETQARTELTGVDWQVFYAYISVMKKSKEFWVDLGYLDDINPHIQAKDVIKADAEAVLLNDIITLTMGVGIAIRYGFAEAVAALTGLMSGYGLLFYGLSIAAASAYAATQ